MQPVLKLVENLTYQYMVGAGTAKAYNLGPMIILGVIFTAGCLFLGFALFSWLTTVTTIAIAALFTGLAMMLTAALFIWYKDLKVRQEIAVLERQHRELLLTTQSLMQDSSMITREIEDFTQTSPKESLLLASLAGFFISDIMRK